MNVESRERTLSLNFDSGATASFDLAKVELSEEQIAFIDKLARQDSEFDITEREDERRPVRSVFQPGEFEKVRGLCVGLREIAVEGAGTDNHLLPPRHQHPSSRVGTPSLTTDVAWCDALSKTDQHESRRAITEYVERDPRPDLSLGQFVDALLRWSFDPQPVSFELAALVITAALDHPGLRQSPPVERQTVSRLSQHVLGWTITLPNKGASDSLRPDDRVLSRAIAAGVYPLPIAANEHLIDSARAACVALHSCFYVEAAQALTVLCGHMQHAAPPVLFDSLLGFIEQGYAHLTALAAAHHSATLSWELRVMKEPYRWLTCRT